MNIADVNPQKTTGCRRLANALGDSPAFVAPMETAQRVLLLASVGLVLIVKMINSAIEATVDRVSPARHPLAERAKNMGSAAVLSTAANAVRTWTFILRPVVLG